MGVSAACEAARFGALAQFGECVAITYSCHVIAGRLAGSVAGRLRGWRSGLHTARPESSHASLREDYLSQVQRDFLSRRLRGNTPSECALASTDEIVSDEKSPLAAGLWGFGAGAANQSKTGVSTPSTLCSLGLVVVYCRNTFFSGKMMGMAPKAASAHS